METFLILFSMAVISGYLLAILILFGKLPSISQSFYEFKERYGEKWTWVFTVALLLFAIPIMIAGLSKTAGNTFQFLAFIAPAGIIFTAVAPRFKEDLEKGVHYRGALTGIVGGMLGILLMMQFYYIAFLGMTGIALLGWLKVKNQLYWLEVLVFYLYAISLLFY